MPRVLVIGADGYLGRNVLVALRTRPDLRVRAATRSGGGDVCLDLAGHPGHVAAVLTEEMPDVVVNCAGAVSGTEAELTAANVTGPATLVTALARVAPGIRLVHLGSAAEYGATEIGVPVTEDMPATPVSAYGRSKLAGTRLVVLGRSAGLDTVVLRVFNPIGPHSPTASLPGRVVSELVRAVATRDDIHLGPLSSVRDFVDVRDIARAVLAAVGAATLDQPILNLGSGVGTPVRSIVDELATVAGFTGSVVESSAGSDRSAAVPWQRADISAIGGALDWKPGIALRDSLVDLWASAR